MDLGLKKKRVILAGATAGMGKATALIFAQEGCDVAVCARGEEALNATLDELKTFGGKVLGHSVDMTDDRAYRDWINSAAEQLDGCDIFIPFASARGGPPSEETWRACFELDVMSLHRGLEAVMPYLAKSDSASVVSIASSAATEEFLGPQPFSAMKAAIINFTSNMSHAVAPQGVRMNCVSPGPINFEGGVWEYIRENMPDVFTQVESSVALKRLGTPEEVAKAIVFVASPACSFMTGANILIDGGITKRVQY